MNNTYDLENSLPNKLLNEDGSVTDLMGNEVTPTSDVWKSRRSIPNKFLNPDGTYSTLQEIISGSIDTEIYVVVEELPTSGDSNKIYLVPQQDGTIDEYHWTGSKWDPIGMLEFDITNYSTTDEMQQAIATALQSAKDYSDTNFLKKTNTIAYTPTADYHPATKKYVDDVVGDIETILQELDTGGGV